MAKLQDIDFYRGEDVLLKITLTPTTDITDWTITMTVRKQATDADPPSFSKSISAGITITDGPNGKFDVAIADTDTTGLTAGVFFYDIKRMDAGLEAVLVTGHLDLKQEVTR